MQRTSERICEEIHGRFAHAIHTKFSKIILCETFEAILNTMKLDFPKESLEKFLKHPLDNL